MYSLYNGHLLGTKCFDPYTEVAFVEGLFCTQTVHLGPGLCIAVDLSSGVSIKEGLHYILTDGLICERV